MWPFRLPVEIADRQQCTNAAHVWNIARSCDRQASQGGSAKPILLNLETLFNAVIQCVTVAHYVDSANSMIDKRRTMQLPNEKKRLQRSSLLNVHLNLTPSLS